MNPLVRRGQERRPSQPIEPLDAEAIRQCQPVIEQWLSKLPSSSMKLAVLTYLTDSSALAPWVLGLSASSRAVPLIVAGNGMRWGGAGVKLPAARRAVQLLAAHTPELAVVFADGSDTAVANDVTPEAASLLRDVVHGGSVLVSGECGSWPQCYRPQYADHAAFQSCVSQHLPACYPNSGLYAGIPSTLLRFLRALDQHASQPALAPPERGDDQAAMHALYQHQSSADPPSTLSDAVPMVVDAHQALFGGLHACKGSGASRRLVIKGTNFSLCHHGMCTSSRHLPPSPTQPLPHPRAFSLTSQPILHVSTRRLRAATRPLA